MTETKKHTSKIEAQHTRTILIAKLLNSPNFPLQVMVYTYSQIFDFSISLCLLHAYILRISTEITTEVEIYSIIPSVSVALPVACPFQHP